MSLILLLASCETGEEVADHPLPPTGDYVVFAWNDLGMHCLNPTYDTAVILPPYNTVWAQVIKRGNPPQVVTSGLTVEYSILNNTFSYGKRDYGQFWDNCEVLFGAPVEQDKGLNLVDPAIHNGLSGVMVAKSGHFEVDGIPVTPVDDGNNWNPYQVAQVTVKGAGGQVVAQTQCTVPTSDEINCSRCHTAANPFQDILQKHDAEHGTNLTGQPPVLCAGCHGSPALGLLDPGDGYLSQVIHGAHADRDATCYDCHPGALTQCNRSEPHTTADGNCTTCHGDMSQVAGSIEGGRVPWASEPRCVDCHFGVPEVDTGAELYRNATGHHGVYCISCHGSPHAMVPSREYSDNYQALQYMESVNTIGSCGVCHSGSKGASSEIDEFGEHHGGSNPEQATVCNVCHTATPTDLSQWPHEYAWTVR